MSSDLKSNVHQMNLNGTNLPVSNIYEFDKFRLDAEHRAQRDAAHPGDREKVAHPHRDG